MFRNVFIGLFLGLCLKASAQVQKLNVPSPPDYTNLKFWIAHPETNDLADLVPGKGEIQDQQDQAEVDVFFVYPTIYLKKQYPDHPWFADVNDPKMNDRIAESTIQYQATVFNGSAKVYSPLYRQGHIKTFFKDSSFMRQVFELAYQDVKRAFDHYLEEWNNKRPIIIASHSQGTVYAARLLDEYFEGNPLMDQLVAAYIIGMPIKKDRFEQIPICQDASQTGCWMTWNTYKKDYYPPKYEKWFTNAASVNPINWKTDDTWASWEENKGGVLRNFNRLKPRVCDAQNHQGILWVHKPKFFGNFLITTKRYHVADYNLFYMNIRENVTERIRSYFAYLQTASPAPPGQD